MASDAESYAQEIRSKWGQYSVDWPPGAMLSIGDYGRISRGIFQKEGNLTDDYGIKFSSQTSPANAHYSHFSRDAVQVNFRARGQSSSTENDIVAGLDVTFHKENAVFFNAAGCHLETMSSPAMLRSRIIDLFKQGKWEYKWRVVTRLICSSSCTVLVASSGGATASLDVDADTAKVELNNANLRMSVSKAEGISGNAVVTGQATPLLSCHRLKSKFLDGIHWTPAQLMDDTVESPLARDKLAEAITQGILKEEEFEWVEVE